MEVASESQRRYDEARIRLLEFFIENRDVLQPIPWKSVTFPWDAFTYVNPSAKVYPQLVLAELNYDLSEAQCSWAVREFCIAMEVAHAV